MEYYDEKRGIFKHLITIWLITVEVLTNKTQSTKLIKLLLDILEGIV